MAVNVEAETNLAKMVSISAQKDSRFIHSGRKLIKIISVVSDDFPTILMQSSSLNVGEEGPSAEAEEESSSMEVEVVTSEPSAKKISKADACLKREAIDC